MNFWNSKNVNGWIIEYGKGTSWVIYSDLAIDK